MKAPTSDTRRVNTPGWTALQKPNALQRSAQPVHRLQGIRYPGRDYRIPAFYMITMSTFARKPLFANCTNRQSLLTHDGWLVHDRWHRMAKDYAEIETSTLMIMPDHFHGIVRVTAPMEKPVGVPLRAFKSQVTSALRQRYGNPKLQVWMPGYHDLAVWRKGSLSAYIHYIMDNPRRYCLKRDNPELFTCVNRLRHTRLPANETWSGYGNLFLLDKPEIRAVRVSRNVDPVKLEMMSKAIDEWARGGGVIASPFISPGEKELGRVALDAGGSVIVMRPNGFARTFKPGGRHFDHCVQGRMLFLACRSPAGSDSTLSREMCLAMNQWCEHIANALQTINRRT